jgi:5-methylcytosine-specific restriction enzyme A
MKPCAGRCGSLVQQHGPARCERCDAKREARDVAERGTASERGYDGAWRKLRAAYFATHPACEATNGAAACGAPGAIVDHVKPHRGDDALRLDPMNLQTLCRRHHTMKTVGEGQGHRAPRRA